MYRIGLSSSGVIPDEPWFIACREAGVAAAEISPKMSDYVRMDHPAIAAAARRAGIELWSYHLPFMPFETVDISSVDPAVRKSTVEWDAELIRKAGDMGIPRYVIHASGEPIEEADRDERMKYAAECLATLAEVAAQAGGVIAVEDLPRACLGRDSSDILRLLEADPRLRVCCDTNHLLSESLPDFIRKIGKKIITLHVSDYDAVNERHWLPGEGVLPWSEVVSALEEIGYDGVWMYEIGFTCPKTILRDRDLTPEDFVRNANEILTGKQPTVFSRPKENLGFWE